MRTHIIFLIFIVLSIISCNEPQEIKDLNKVLQLAGENRSELDKVLKYYSDNPTDSLKYKAACFLIVNMPGHYSYKDTVYTNKYYNEIDSVAAIYKDQPDHIKDSLYRGVKIKYNDRLELIEDIHYITADFLIDNIERSFDVWQKGSWAKHIDFDDFCEYILPYKSVESQTLDNWREYFSEYSKNALNNLQYCELYKNLTSKACETVNNDIRNKVRPRLINESHISVRRMSTLEKIPFGLCDDYVTLATSVMRAKGIPVCIDFTPQWPFRSLGHNWNVLLENSGINTVFEGADSSPGTPHKKDHKMAKVFRRTYAINKEIQQIYLAEKYVPSTFKTPFIKDVTNEYQKTKDVEVSVKNDKYKYVYLAVFDNVNWVPIHWAKVKGGKAVFRNMGKEVVYLPVHYGERGIIPFSDPILVTLNGEIKELKADTLDIQDLTLQRKFPVFPHLFDIGMRVVGGRIQVADNANFMDSKTLHTITDYGIQAKEIRLDSISEAYRYWRYYPPEFAFGNMAEISFFEKGSITPIKGKIIGIDGSYRDDGLHNKEAVFDGNALTFFDAPHHNDCWVGMDFGKPVNIERIIYIPRNDGNIIETGDEYELVFWNNNTWESLGRKIADNAHLAYEGCPRNALFLLHNHTKGEEERIFTYENDNQIWW